MKDSGIDYRAVIRRGVAGSDSVLVDFLFVFGDKTMAEDYLNSGNATLSAAAGEWAKLSSYRIVGARNYPGPRWGGR
jgi:hypothetical protein